MGITAAFAWLGVWAAYGKRELALTVESLLLAVPVTYAVVRYYLWGHRLRTVWRSGVRVDVTLKKSLYFWTRAYRYRVELDDGRWAMVILRASSKPGGRLPALVDGDLLVVSDFGGVLKPGRLRRAPQTMARAV